jgi:sulfonate transport system ATP-binding protein
MNSAEKGYEITIHHVSKNFDKINVLRDVDFSVRPGDFVAIVGHSGCGKSTLLRMIEGLDFPTEGTISVNGKIVTGVDSRIRFVFQDPRLLPWKSVIDNVRLGSCRHDLVKAEEALVKVGLSEKRNVWPSVLSGGQKQRVSLARALSGNPSVLLLDEPLGALDALTRLEMQGLIESLWEEQKFTAILVTHDVFEAVKLANKVIIIDDHTVTQNLEISLSRPRIKNNDSSYFEQKILHYLMRQTVPERSTAGFTI